MSKLSKYNILIFLVLISSTCFGLSKIDSLNQAIHQIQNKKELVEAKLKLIAFLINDDQIQQAEKLVNEVRFNKLAPIQKGELLYNEGMIYQSHYDYSNAMKMFLEATKVAMTQDNVKLKNAANFRIAELFFKEKEYDQAINILEDILKNQSANKILLSQCHEVLGDAYFQKKIFGQAKTHFKIALDLKIATKQYEGAATLASFMGKMVNDLEAFDEAINYHRMSLNWHQSQKDKVGSAKDYYNIALVNLAAKEYDDGFENITSAIHLLDNSKNVVELASFYALKGRLFAKTGNSQAALAALRKARSFLKTDDEMANGTNVLEHISETCHLLGDDQMAFLVHKDFVRAKNIKGTFDKAKELGTMKMRFESEFQSEKVKQEVEKLEVVNAYNTRVKYFLLAMLGLMGILVFFILKSLNLKKKTNYLLQKRNETIEFQAKALTESNHKMELTNQSLEELNQKLIVEMSERESIENSSFSRDKFLATMSQEMKTPLNAIVGLSNLLIEDRPRPEQVQNLRSLQFAANDMTVFVNDILDYSKIEAGKLTILKREFKLEHIVDDICNRFENEFDKKGVTFVCEYDKNIPEIIYGDDVRINQILTNFISFALSDSKTTHIKSKIIFVKKDDECVKIDFDLWFDGEFISEDRIKKIFRKENMASDGYPRRLLGIAIAKRLVDLQHGSFEIQSSVGNGTNLSAKLGYKLLDVDRIIFSKEEQIKMLENKKVLVVEDNKINQLVVQNMLTKLGMNVVTADNGQEGLLAIQNQDFDLVLMDIQMPIMDGYKATSEIRKLSDSNKSQVPIIALTASAFLTEAEKAQLFGMDDHVGKPFSLDDLVDKITVLLMGKQQSGQ